MTNRQNGRGMNQLREVSLTTGVNPYAEGSCLIKFGFTEVLCTASVQDKVPQWLKGKGQGWVTAEYGMLPRATGDRKDREATRGKQEGRTLEIQRLVGRSLRSVCNLAALDGFTVWLDCDVLVADGGTRTASITGAYVALALALKEMAKLKKLKAPLESVLTDQVAAISCGVTSAGPVLDMDYAEDSSTIADGNFVMSSKGGWVEVQVTGEQRPVSNDELTAMRALAEGGIAELFQLQRAAIAASA
jgi:ribonuclease PH